MSARRLIPLAAAAGLVLIGMSAEGARCAGWRVNLTASAPRGVYRLQPLTTLPIHRGSLVELCPPAWVTPTAFPFYMRGDCAGGGKALLKTIVGVPGDRIAVTEVGITVNGVRLPGSAPMSKSVQYPDISLPRFRCEVVLGPEQYWVYGSGARPELAALSFDSRYFGPVSTGQIRASAILATTPRLTLVSLHERSDI